MSDYKINQNMEFGDIIYFILLAFFMILGFFNDSRKKKKQKQWEAEQREVEFAPFSDEQDDEIVLPTPPPLPAAPSAKERYENFQSSIDLVSIHEEPSAGSSYIFDYEANSFYEEDPDAPDAPEKSKENNSNKIQHPFLRALKEETGREELKKGLIYGEIILRKY